MCMYFHIYIWLGEAEEASFENPFYVPEQAEEVAATAREDHEGEELTESIAVSADVLADSSSLPLTEQLEGPPAPPGPPPSHRVAEAEEVPEAFSLAEADPSCQLLLADAKEVADFLKDLHLESYCEQFMALGIETSQDFTDVGFEDLCSMGLQNIEMNRFWLHP